MVLLQFTVTIKLGDDMVKVCFINKENEVFEMDYTEVLDFCKGICLRNENINEFNQFKNNYTIFEPYFDFVTFRLDYIFCAGHYQLVHYENPNTGDHGLYDAAVESRDYHEIMYAIAKMIAMNIEGFPVLKIAKCSDKDLNIELIDDIPRSSFVIDRNMMGFISKSGDPEGSHPVTANTILNQFLIHDNKILESILNYISYNGFSDGIGLNYLEDILGYMRITNSSLVFNGAAINPRQRLLVDNAKVAGYIVEDKDADVEYPKAHNPRVMKG